MLFNLDFVNNTILSCFFFFISDYWLTDIYFLILAVITKVFNPIAELVIPLGIPTKEGKTEMEMRPVIVEFTINKGSI